MEGIPKNTWDQVLGNIRGKVSAHSFQTWFKPTRFIDEDARSLRVRVPNTWFADWLTTNYQAMIQEALSEADRQGLLVDFRPAGDEAGLRSSESGGGHSGAAMPRVRANSASPSSPNGRGLEARRAVEADAPPTFNPRYTFERFVVSSCNQFAHAASKAVAEQLSRAYNPLYIYGGVGLGKTHLMQAIGHEVAGRRLRMCYISSEHFMNELINAIRFEKTLEFKDRYRSVDLLLIDDIQFLAGKERTQEEFFHTFNSLYDAQKQIVLTSDVPPRDIPLLEDRLRSRFEWGLIADIQPPDLETKVAILQRNAELEKAVLPDDVALFIASNCGSNVRELEGALIRLIAFSSVSGREITIDLARETLQDIIVSSSPSATVESIQKLISNYYNLPVSQLKARTNSHQISFPRQIAMYLCKQLTSCSLQEIGRRFGGKHHSTVIHGVQKIERKRGEDAEFDKLIESFNQSLK